MSKFTKELIDNYADKVLIGLTEEENKMVLNEFDLIDKNMEIISNFSNITNVEPMTHTLDNFSYSPRKDECEKNTDESLLFKNCKNVHGREIEVPKVVN